MYKRIIKRFFDFWFAFFLLIILLPVIILITMILTIANNGKPFFFQDRPGEKERKIRIWKFKSMNDKTDVEGRLLPDVQRITKFGSFIRNTSLDELPQLFNVLIGDMSLIGPRPLLFKYLPLYSKEQRKRHLVKPGITGLAQVNGRNSISWNEKFKFDIYYVDNISFLLDLKILWLTFIKVLKRDGVNQSESRPMQPFNGNN